MKLISWNVNGLRAILRKGNLQELIKTVQPDILALQETKMQIDQLNEDFSPYYRYMSSALKKGYSGTLVLTKEKPLSVSYDLKGEHPQEGRIITLEYNDFYFVNCYIPNSKEGLLRLPYRLYFEDCLRQHLCDLDKIKPVIYTGDLNVAHQECDLKNPQSNHFNPGFSDEEREKMSQLLASGFVDTYRFLYPQNIKYSWWSYRQNAREKNVGWRIDYFLVSKRFIINVLDSLILNEYYGSDHCPVGLLIERKGEKNVK